MTTLAWVLCATGTVLVGWGVCGGLDTAQHAAAMVVVLYVLTRSLTEAIKG